MKNSLTSLARNVLLPLEVTAAASETYGAFQKKIFESGQINNLRSRNGLYHRNSSVS